MCLLSEINFQGDEETIVLPKQQKIMIEMQHRHRHSFYSTTVQLRSIQHGRKRMTVQNTNIIRVLVRTANVRELIEAGL